MSLLGQTKSSICFQIVIKTEFAKRPTVGRHGGDWTARISAEPSSRVPPDANPVHSFIVYIALGDDSITSTLRPIISKTAPSDAIDIIHGSSSTLGDFTLRLSNATNVLAQSFLITHIDPIPDMRQLQEVMIAGTGVRDIQSPHLTLHLALIGIQPSPQKDTVASPPNIVAIQITFLKSTTFDIIFESASASADRVDTLTGDVFTTEIDRLKRSFEDQFENAFGLKSKVRVNLFGCHIYWKLFTELSRLLSVDGSVRAVEHAWQHRILLRVKQGAGCLQFRGWLDSQCCFQLIDPGVDEQVIMQIDYGISILFAARAVWTASAIHRRAFSTIFPARLSLG